MIELNRLTKRYAGQPQPAVDGVDLSVQDGELVALLGESGCGKTTTLKMINRLVEPTGGSIVIGGEDAMALDQVALRRRIGYVIQQTGLFPHMTVEQNVAVVPHLLRWSAERIDTRVDELLEMVALPPAEFRARRPAQLSGGQRQRVGLARALAGEPTLMLMDEPFGALDPLTRDALQGEFRALHDRLGLTTIMVTHDMTEALLLADRIAVMRLGKLVRVGTPHELLTDPRDDDVAMMMASPKRQADRLEALAGEG